MNDGTYEGILNQDDVQEYFNGDDARPFYPERAETVIRQRTHYDGCYRVHPECAFRWIEEHDGANARWHSFETVQAIVKERDDLRAELERVTKERDAAHQSRNRIVWLVRRYCDLNRMNLEFFLDSEKLLKDSRIKLDAANMTLATLCDMVLGEDAADRSDDALVRAVGMLKRERDATNKRAEQAEADAVRLLELFRLQSIRSFVAGAGWWEFHQTQASMWASDRDEAWAHAEKRFPFVRVDHREVDSILPEYDEILKKYATEPDESEAAK